MDKDPANGGTSADGTKSAKYCSYCYESGSFRDNFKSSGEMVKFVKEKLREMGNGPIKRWFYTSHISSLERWNN